MKKRYRSPIAAAVHETASDLNNSGLLSKKDMRHFDETCLTPVKPLTPTKIQLIRERENASQAVFARHLGLSTTLISQWERGEKSRGARPSNFLPWSTERDWTG